MLTVGAAGALPAEAESFERPPVIEVSAGEAPEKLILAGGTLNTDLNAQFDDDGVATISAQHRRYRSQPAR